MSIGQSWIILIFSAVLEAIWATALGMSDGLSKLTPTIVFFVANVASLVGLGIAMRKIPTSVAYATWTGLGASLTVIWAMVTGAEPPEILRIVFLVILIACVAGLKFFDSESDQAQSDPILKQ